MANDPATRAALAQRMGGSAGYGADTWINVILEPMTKLWQGIGGKSDFFFSEEDARQAKGSYVGSTSFRFAETLWRLAQVEPSKMLGFRDGIREFVVDLRTPAAISVCKANPVFGSGSVVQYFVPDWQKTVCPTGREYKFAAKSYPNL